MPPPLIKSLSRRDHELANASRQVEFLESENHLARFEDYLSHDRLLPYKPTQIEIFQVNMGKMCNQTCRHCHVDAGPDRKEIMTKETMQECLRAIKNSGIHTVDLTGGAPEMNPYFRWFVRELYALDCHIIVRCNLTIIVANAKYHDLPQFYKDHKVEVVSSLPHFTSKRTDAQRGDGVFDASILALKMLNSVGYGMEDSDLQLNLVYNPSGAFLPGDQNELEQQFKKQLKSHFGISFHQLFAITNLPISRFLEYLIDTQQYDDYMEQLIQAYNPAAAAETMCRNTISVGYDGNLYDCDFNQMLNLNIAEKFGQHVRDFNTDLLEQREIIVNRHCFGCTAGAGSSCGGQTA